MRMRSSALCFTFLFAFLSGSPAYTQTQTFSLPSHPGAMVLDLDGFHITQQSAEPEGQEIGVRARDDGHTQLLAFLFLTPEHKEQTPATCLQQDITEVRKRSGKFNEQRNPSGKDSADVATILLTYSSDGRQALYKYAGTGDQCLVVEVYADKGSKLDVTKMSTLLERQSYSAAYTPTADDAATYEGVRRRAMVAAAARSEIGPKILVTWSVPGGIPLPTDSEWKLDSLTALDSAARPIAFFKNEKTGVTAGFFIWENISGNPTAEGCRKDSLDRIWKASGDQISNETVGTVSDGHGREFATAFHLWGPRPYLHDVFAFAGDAKVCAEIQVSTTDVKPDEKAMLVTAIALFHPDFSYLPTCMDYLAQANVYYRETPMLGAPFYSACRKTIPPDTKDVNQITMRRVATDKVVIAFVSSGRVDQSRVYAERAIKIDPDYPINYYNLACADAEQGKAMDAQMHLQQAFERKGNVISGETMPDPTKDHSILKLKKNKEFWDFVQTLK
jgi:tetratricopeptide (TPR) repeat protein